ncbi:hypothetical protein Tco_0695472 [Tanacetum coccineum]
MAALKFASSHNMVAFLDKPTESDGFKQIVDCLNIHPIKHALMVNPTIYTACIEQFWATTKVKTINGEVQIQALVDKKKVIITDTSVRSDLQLEDAKAPKPFFEASQYAMKSSLPSGKLSIGLAIFENTSLDIVRYIQQDLKIDESPSRCVLGAVQSLTDLICAGSLVCLLSIS